MDEPASPDVAAPAPEQAIPAGKKKRRARTRVVTAKQRAAYEMRKGGSTWEEVAAAMGISAQSARNNVKAGERNGLEKLFTRNYNLRASRPGVVGRPDRLKDGEGLFAKEGTKFDPKVFGELAASAGIPPRLAAALARRVEANYGVVRAELTKMTLAQQVEATNEKAQLVLTHIDEVSIAGMNAKDLAMAYGILVDKAQLLGGKPTQVFDFNLRAKLEVIMPQFLAEARRRGITIEGEFRHAGDSELRNIEHDEPAAAVHERADSDGAEPERSVQPDERDQARR